MGAFVNTVPLVLISIALVMLVIYAVFPKIKGLHFTSELLCPKCKHAFEYNWLPGGAFTAVRLGKYRFMRCPNCGGWSWFDIWTTRVPSE